MSRMRPQVFPHIRFIAQDKRPIQAHCRRFHHALTKNDDCHGRHLCTFFIDCNRTVMQGV